MTAIHHPSRRGTTLVEAILALAILSISIFVLIEATSRCLAMLRTARSYQSARAVLDLGELEHPMTTNSPEDCMVSPMEYPGGFTFSRDLQGVDGEDRLYLVTTRVVWAEHGQSAREEVIGYYYAPKKSTEL